MPSTSSSHAIRDTARVSSLISLIYESAAAPSRWHEFVEGLGEALELKAANFAIAGSAEDGIVRTIPVSWGFDETEVAAYEEHFVHLDPHRPIAAAQPQGTVLSAEQMIPDAEFVGTEYFNDFYAPAGYRHGFGAVIYNTGPVSCAMVCHRGPDQAPASQDDLRLLGLFVPHLHNARIAANNLGTLHDQRRLTVGVVDRIPVGIIFVDASGRVLHANSQAHSILQEEDGLSARDGKLAGARPSDTQKLLGSITTAAATARGKSHDAPASVRLPRPSERRPLDVTACPVDIDTQVWSDVRAVAYLVVSDGLGRLDGVAPRMMDLYGLSSVEAALAVAIARGITVSEWAERRGVSVETVRWQLKQVFAKTDTSRQPELVRLVLLGPGLLR